MTRVEETTKKTGRRLSPTERRAILRIIAYLYSDIVEAKREVADARARCEALLLIRDTGLAELPTDQYEALGRALLLLSRPVGSP